MTDTADFVHLHTHTEYSFLDGAIRIKDLVTRAKQFNMPALAITDHGGMFGTIDFYSTCIEEGIKPIIGFEAYVAPGSRLSKEKGENERSYYHLLLLAENNEGYRNLMKLSSIGYLEGFYRKPRIDTEVLRAHSKGIIAASGCIAGAIPRALLDDDVEKARRIAREYLDIFGENNFFIELQDHGIEEEQRVRAPLIELGNELGIPFIATNDAHYLRKEDASSHEALLCIQTRTTMDDPKRYRFSTDQVYFKSPQEMAQLFSDVPRALYNTVEIAQRCNVEVKSKAQLPVLEVPEGMESQEEYLRTLSYEGLEKKYPEVTAELKERLEYELHVIISMGFAGYFLIVRDFVRAAKDMNIAVGCRGSAAGSLVAYCVDITNIDPVKYDLLFERFLNPERVSMPDADIDFADHDRYKVIEYVVEKYGRDAVCQIINFGRMKAKMVVRDVARVLGVPVSESNKLAEMVQEKTIEKSIAANGELRDVIDNNPVYQQLFKHARALEGLARQAGMHAGGVIIAPGPVTNWAPLFKQPQTGIVMTQFDMDTVEDSGLIKMDFLGLRTLTVLQESCELISRSHATHIKLWDLPLDDAATFELFGSGETTGVFQFESKGMQDYLRKLKPTNIEDIIAMAALYRPGPMENIPTYIARKHGREEIHYPHPLLKEVLDVTNGVIIYQEQVMRIAQIMAGFSLGQADILRKAISKKKEDKMEKLGAQFIEGAVKKGIKKQDAEKVYDLIKKFANYGFNKAHATAYAHVSYQAAYLKAHYPVEFMTASLTSVLNNQEQFLVIKNEAERMGITILPPDINRSEIECAIDEGNIRVGLGTIKNVGKAAQAILDERRTHGEFTSIFDATSRVDHGRMNKKCMESLICAGAFDSVPGTRAQQFEAIQTALDYGAAVQKEKNSGQTNLFSALNGGNEEEDAATPAFAQPSLPEVDKWSYGDLLLREKEVLNFYVSGHPLKDFEDEARGFSSVSLAPRQLQQLKADTSVTVAGMVTTCRIHTQRNGQRMAFFSIEDFEGLIECVAFGDAFGEYAEMITADAMLLLRGTIMYRQGAAASGDEQKQKPQIRIEKVMPLSQAREKLTKSVHIRLRTRGLEEEFLDRLSKVCSDGHGQCQLLIHFETKNGNNYTVHARKFTVSPHKDTIERLRSIVGEENVWLDKKKAA